MEQDKGFIERHKIAIFGSGALLVIGLIFLIIVIIAALVFLIGFSEPQSVPPIIGTSNPSVGIPNSNTGTPDSLPIANTPNDSNVPNSVIPSNDSLWAAIELSFVEKSCLVQAKIQADDLDWAVNSCSCSETKTDSEKNYSCAVSALDRKHDLQVNCIKKNNNCTIISEQGNSVFTFEQLYSLVQ
ncbi:MAG: hypothetical protein ABIH20_03245 [Candidatus Diapherotrites archaeon]